MLFFAKSQIRSTGTLMVRTTSFTKGTRFSTVTTFSSKGQSPKGVSKHGEKNDNYSFLCLVHAKKSLGPKNSIKSKAQWAHIWWSAGVLRFRFQPLSLESSSASPDEWWEKCLKTRIQNVGLGSKPPHTYILIKIKQKYPQHSPTNSYTIIQNLGMFNENIYFKKQTILRRRCYSPAGSRCRSGHRRPPVNRTVLLCKG